MHASEERAALGRVVAAMQHYRQDAELEVQRWECNYKRLSPAHQALLSSHPHKCAVARAAINTNDYFLQSMLRAYDASEDGSPPEVPPMLAYANSAGAEVVRYLLSNLARDWSAEGQRERDQSYGRICTELASLFHTWPAGQAPPRVLVPGTGLARLCCEVASLGYAAEGNEFSYFMLLASSFILNQLSGPEEFTIHPFVLNACNHVGEADQARGLEIPDRHPSELVRGEGLLSMCAGDFVVSYGAPSMAASFDSVVTCFFIDTAHNVLQYLEVIHHCLKPGGYWVNLGPLLWHWADFPVQADELSVELSLEELRRVASQMGFTMLREESVEARYIADQRSMFKTTYQASFWTMVKSSEPPVA
ncbi:MAG: hypothetical protein WDW38_008663 [Sanguina aurantia]